MRGTLCTNIEGVQRFVKGEKKVHENKLLSLSFLCEEKKKQNSVCSALSFMLKWGKCAY